MQCGQNAGAVTRIEPNLDTLQASTAKDANSVTVFEKVLCLAAPARQTPSALPLFPNRHDSVRVVACYVVHGCSCALDIAWQGVLVGGKGATRGPGSLFSGTEVPLLLHWRPGTFSMGDASLDSIGSWATRRTGFMLSR